MKMKKYLWGIFFIAAAVLLVVGKLGIVGKINVWSLMFTALFAAALVESVLQKSVTGVLFSVAFLCIIYDEQLKITALTPWTVLGAALFGSIGISFFYTPKRRYKGHLFEKKEGIESIETVEGEQEMEFAAKFGGSIKYINSEDFRAARVEAFCSGMKLYFDHAMIQGDQAVLDMKLSCSGLELYIPKEWMIVNEAHIFVGAVEEKNNRKGEVEKRLILRGEMKLSGVTVVYV